MKDPSWAVFDRDARIHGGYLYTVATQLSSVLAKNTSRDLVLSVTPFEGRTVLDVGCGDGYYSHQYWDLGHPRRLLGVDASAEAIKVAGSRCDGRPIEFAVADSHRLPFADASFDVALLQSNIHHDDDPKRTLREAFRVATTVVIHEPNGNNPGLKVIERVSRYHRKHHERSFTPRRIGSWIDGAGGRVTGVRFAGFVPMFAPNWLASAMRALEALIEATPLVNSLCCAVYVVTAVRSD